jgi:hypothetical protein
MLVINPVGPAVPEYGKVLGSDDVSLEDYPKSMQVVIDGQYTASWYKVNPFFTR